MRTDESETLGTGSNAFAEMNFSIEKVTVTAKSRALKAEYSLELAQDLGSSRSGRWSELANILSTEVLAEINVKLLELVSGCKTRFSVKQQLRYLRS